jgi:hypothetical protein
VGEAVRVDHDALEPVDLLLPQRTFDGRARLTTV